MIDQWTYVGMDIHAALAKAHEVGDQVRILSNGQTIFRYAEPAEPHHIPVKVDQGVITSVVQ